MGYAPRRAKRYTRKYGRRSAVFRRRFPTRRSTVRLLPPAQRHPDREMIRMKSMCHYRFSPSTALGTNPQTGCSFALYVSMNNIFNPGTHGPFTSQFETATGFNAQSLLYAGWQVRGARISVRINQANTPATTPPQQVETYWVCVPMSNAQFAAFTPSTIAFQRLMLMPHRSGVHALSQTPYNTQPSGGPDGSCLLKCFSAPQALESPGYLTNIPASSGVATVSVPTTTPVFVIAGVHAENYTGSASDVFFDMDINIEYSVVWFGRVITSLPGEPPRPDQVEAKVRADSDMAEHEDDDEEAFNAIREWKVAEPTADELKERKEEKKEEKKASPAAGAGAGLAPVPLVRTSAMVEADLLRMFARGR